MNKIYDQCWESREEYALDITLFKEYWESIKENSFEFIIKLFEIQLKGKTTYDNYIGYSWEEMSKYVFYEDIEFAKNSWSFTEIMADFIVYN